MYGKRKLNSEALILQVSQLTPAPADSGSAARNHGAFCQIRRDNGYGLSWV